MVSHAKKVIVKADPIYFWDNLKEHGYLEPSLTVTFSLAKTLHSLRGNAITQVQFNELVGLIKSQEVSTAEELFKVKECITAGSGMSFAP
jgi:hypothetical protein